MRRIMLYKVGLIIGMFLAFSLKTYSTNLILAGGGISNDISNSQAFSKDIKKAGFIEKRILKIYDNLLKYTVNIRSGGTGNLVSRGTGVLVSADGYILTAAHVINGMKNDVVVRLHDGTVHAAICLGQDEMGDYGLLKIIDEGKWEYARMGESSGISKNEACLMFGFPGVFTEVVPAAMRIGFFYGRNSNGYLQASCIMMPGDSGGPLFNLEGEVIGTCSHIDEPLTQNFYAPIDSIKKNWGRLVKGEVFNKKEKDKNPFADTDLIEAASISKKFVLEGGKKSLSQIIESQTGQLYKSVVKIVSTVNEESIDCYGTVISTDGYIISKSSRVGGENVCCELYDGQNVTAKIIGRNEAYDLVLVKVENKSLAPVKTGRKIDYKEGQLFGTVGLHGKVIHTGILGIRERDIPEKKEIIEIERGYLGANFITKDSAIIIEMVKEGHAAKNAGIVEGDKILEFGSVSDISLNSIYSFLSKTKPGQKIQVKVLRNGNETKEFDITLGKEPKRTEGINPAYKTEVSKRRSGFPNVLTHDMPLQLAECGTPVVNLAGKVIGINIARQNRPSSFAIPLLKVKEVIQTILKEEGIDEKIW